MAQELHVLSPEKTIITYQLSGIGSRAMAHLLDVFILFCVLYGVLIVAGLLTVLYESEVMMAPVIVFATFAPFLYFILFEGLWNGQTPGKRALRLRVRLADGTPITFSAALMRNLLRPADLLPGTYFVGLAAMFTNNRSQRLGDMASGTVVIHEPKTIPNFQPLPPRVLMHPLEERLGPVQKMSESEYAVIRRLRDRLPELAPNIQKRMLDEVWLPLCVKYSIPNQPDIHPSHFIEATIIKYERENGLL